MALQTRTYTQTTDHNSEYAINLTLTEESTDTTSNTSTLTWSLFLTTGSSGYNGKVNEISCSINGDVVYSEANQTHNYSTHNYTYNIASGTKNSVKHNDDGNKTINVQVTFKSPSGAAYSPGNATISSTFTLTFIPRTSKINNVSINLTNNIISWNTTKYSNSFVDNITIYSLDKSFTINSIAKVDSNTLTSSQLNTLYSILGTSTSTTVNAYLKTYNNGTLIGTSNIVPISISLPSYSLNWTTNTCVDNINTYDSYKNDSTDLIAYLSNPLLTFVAQSSTGSNYGRTIGYTINNIVATSPTTITSYTGQSLVVKATDGRTAKDITYTPSNTIIPYKKPTIQCSLVRTSPTATTATATITGTYYDGDGLTNLDSLGLTLNYQETGGSEITVTTFTISSSTTDHIVSFSAVATLTGLDYTKGISYSAVVTDLLSVSSSPISGTVPRGRPAWNAYYDGNGNSNFNVYGYIKRNEDCFFPIGYIYMSVDSTDPATYFGGTWTRIKDTFLLACGNTYNNGATGGSATNSHTHGYSHTHGVPGVSHSHTLSDGYAQINHHDGYFYFKEKSVTTYAASGRGASTGANNTTNQSDGIGLGGSSGSTTPNSTTTNSQNKSTTDAPSDTNNMPPYLAVYMWKRTS